jgi:signal peptidase II
LAWLPRNGDRAPIGAIYHQRRECDELLGVGLISVLEVPMGSIAMHALALIALDQVSKAIALSCVGKDRAAPLGSHVRLRCVINHRGILGSATALPVPIALWLFAVGTALWLAAYTPIFQSRIAEVGLGWALGGATGNLMDRVYRGGVVDFVDCRVWPIFNIADAAIVTGTVLALLSPLVGGLD